MTNRYSHRGLRLMGGTPPAEPLRDSKSLVPRVMRLFGPYRSQVTIVVFLILTTAVVGVVNPRLIQVVFDDGLGLASESGVPNIRLLWILGGVMVAIAAINAGLGIIQTYMTNKVGQYVMRDLRDAVYSHLQGMSLRFFTSTRTGEIQSRVSNDVGGIQSVVTNTLSDTIANIAILASTLGVMVLLSWQLTVVAVASVPLYFFMAQWVGKKRREITSKTQKSMAEMTVITQETLSVSGIMLAKLFGRQHEEMANFRHHNQELSDLTVRQQMIGHAFFAVVMAFLSASPVAIYLLAGYLMAGSGSSSVSPRRCDRLHRPAEPPVLPRGAAAAGVGRAAVLSGNVRAHIRLPGHEAGNRGLAHCPVSAPRQGRGGNRLRLGAGQLPQRGRWRG